jgi:hypothetical protein
MGVRETIQAFTNKRAAERAANHAAQQSVKKQLRLVADRQHPDIPVSRGQVPLVEDYGRTARVTVIGPDDRAPAKSYIVRGYGDKKVVSEGDVAAPPVTRR